MAETKKPRRPKGAIPAKGTKCEKTIRPASRFHKGSFRWTFESDHGKGRAAVLVGCPLETRTRSMPKSVRKQTKWNPKAPPGQQCTFAFVSGKAGLLGHKVVQPRRGGACRPGYERG